MSPEIGCKSHALLSDTTKQCDIEYYHPLSVRTVNLVDQASASFAILLSLASTAAGQLTLRILGGRSTGHRVTLNNDSRRRLLPVYEARFLRTRRIGETRPGHSNLYPKGDRLSGGHYWVPDICLVD